MNIFKEDFPLENIKVQYINVHTFQGGEVDVLPVQTNPLLLIPDREGDVELLLMLVTLMKMIVIRHDLPRGKVRWCLIVESNSLQHSIVLRISSSGFYSLIPSLALG